MKLNAAIVALAAVAGVCLPTHAQKKKNLGQNEPAVVEAAKTISDTGALTTSPAAVFVVNSTANYLDASPGNGVCESSPGNGVCTFRAAVMEANALAGADTITFASPLFDTAQTIILLGQVQISSEITINGPGADKLSLSGGNANRVLWAQSSSTATIRDITLANGRADGDIGGGLMISPSANVTVERVHVKDSYAVYGGGIFLDGGALTMTQSALTGNSVSDYGSALFINWGSATITGSTVSGNTQSFAGAIFNGGTLTISDSTITNNSAIDTSAGGIYNVSGLTLRNTIIAGNFSPEIGNSDLFQGGTMTSLGYNLIGIANVLFSGPADQQGTTGSPLDAKLGPLGNNGGTTPTHSLLAGSPAIDAGDSAESADQRGLNRTVDQPGYANAANAADIGAYELQASTAAPVHVSGRVTDRNGRSVYGATVQFIDGSGASKYARTNMFGYYSVADLAAGDSYVVTVQARGLTFAPQLFTPTESFGGLNFTAR